MQQKLTQHCNAIILQLKKKKDYVSFKSCLAVGKVVDFTERLLPYLEARGDGIYVSGLFGGSNKIVNYRVCDRPWWQQ